jgi:hypothetical protein
MAQLPRSVSARALTTPRRATVAGRALVCALSAGASTGCRPGDDSILWSGSHLRCRVAPLALMLGVNKPRRTIASVSRRRSWSAR